MVEKSHAVLQEAASQLPLDTSMEDVVLAQDAGFHIMTDTFDQSLSRRSGKIYRGMGNACHHDTTISSSNTSMGHAAMLMKQNSASRTTTNDPDYSH
ncbi:hypothetical protein D8674_028767 [Pyrus ussuriensis x Pyrus communis]|uniref:Uncharacterized protein n=1 Tax=Pyrus ussuriensis x Pyrus communis TaxID=2448454 RepID=A0A5N5I4J6_9ROSA|nr:hypothetical protein D8674_028767 [Pyrus ussuriensis x Pyrus communis]